MLTPGLSEQIAAAEAYERLHVPALFRQWAPVVLDEARLEPGDRILDVACGTGVLARAAARRVGPDGLSVGIDPDPGMLAVAERLEPRVEWRRGQAESLPFPDQSFDAVVSQFGLMFFSNRRRGLSEMVRVLAMGGMLAVAVWDSLETSPAYSILVELLERLAGGPAADALRAPFVLGDRRDLMELIENSGCHVAKITTRQGTARFPSVDSMVEADLRGWLPAMGVILDEGDIQGILSEAREALQPFVREGGQVVFDLSAHILMGVKT